MESRYDKFLKSFAAYLKFGARMNGGLFPIMFTLDGASFVSNNWHLIPAIQFPLTPIFGATTAACVASAAWNAWRKLNSDKELESQASAHETLVDRFGFATKLIEKYERDQRIALEIKTLDTLLGQAHAFCDATRTKVLSPQLLSHEDRIANVEFAIQANNANLRECLRVLCEILRLLIAENIDVAASVKEIVEWGSGARQLDGAKVKTIYRDPATRTLRGEHDDEKYDIDDNTATKMIYREGKPHWTNNYLVAAYDRGDYINRHEGWQDRYRATSVASIPSMAEEIGKRRTGMLCVDSYDGIFGKECELEIERMTPRIAFLLYHNYILQDIREKLRSGFSPPRAFPTVPRQFYHL